MLKSKWIWCRRTWLRFEDVEFATLTTFDWFIHHPILEPIQDSPAAKFEAT